MKKSMILALACAAFVSSSAFAQEVTYVEDPAQGYTFNRFKDNWFLTAEGGANFQFSKHDINRDALDRFAPAFGLQVGKWFSPLMGFRGGLTYLGTKGLSYGSDAFGLVYDEAGQPKTFESNGHTYYKTKVANLGVNFDAMLNVTNWWCGYKPNRVYNFIAYVGGATYFGLQHEDGSDSKWDTNGFDTRLALRGGIINSFNVSKQVALSLDIRYTAMSATHETKLAYDCINSNLAAFLGVTYLFNQRTWTAPVVPVCPPAENCDPIRARLAEAEARLADTQRKLDECLRRPMPVAEAAPCVAPLATVYFPIGSSTVSRTDANVLKSVAATMKADTSVKYDVCGWADNYTGSDAINARLRQNRANSVKNILVKNGVKAEQLDVTTNPGNKYEGKENVYLDRCVTIQAK
ncbi:MAG: OmpA family protein [Muribaculaceae bacterium]|nr:OmpA family protein [Muribaculaceae bacterium]